MVSATDFLPSFMIEFMNFETTMSPNLGSGLTSRLSALWRRDIDLCSCVDLRAVRRRRACLRLADPGSCRDAGAQEAQFTWASWLRTWSVSACGLPRPACRAR